MALKGKKQTAEHIKKRVESTKKFHEIFGRKKVSESTKEKMSKAHKILNMFNKNPGTFKKGDGGRLGKPHTQMTKKKMSESHKLTYIKNPILLERLKKYRIGKKMSDELKRRLSEYNKSIGRKPPKQIGEKNKNWKGGITKLQEKIRKCIKYRQWRSDVFERDNYTCQICGERNLPGKNLIIHADHIKPFAIILREHVIKSLEEAILCEELWNINNGRTLCLGCHKKTDTYLNSNI